MMQQCISRVKSPSDNARVHNPFDPTPRDPRAVILATYPVRGFNSIRALAIAAGVPQPTLSRYMSGATKDMELDNFRAIARALDLTVGQLLGEVPIHADPRVDHVLHVMERLSGPGRDALIATANALAITLGEPDQ